LNEFLVGFLLTSSAILSVVLGIFGAYCVVSVVLTLLNPAQPSNLLAALVPNQSPSSGD
jgi:hypothetical protein